MGNKRRRPPRRNLRANRPPGHLASWKYRSDRTPSKRNKPRRAPLKSLPCRRRATCSMTTIKS
ncbi:MAG: hypothetical protein EHM77_04595 [Planctomycetaceae bacterium]|nr:MAG: hypothetical protein EHM77_04595 [Planctomycetaceae bacterium]